MRVLKLAAVLVAVGTLAACTTAEKTASGAGVGAAVGALASNSAGGAVAGPRLAHQSSDPHFVYQADAWLHGRLAIEFGEARGNERNLVVSARQDVDDNWTQLGDLEHDRTEFIIPQRHNLSTGIEFRFEEIGTTDPNFKVESLSVYSYAQRIVTPEIQRTI